MKMPSRVQWAVAVIIAILAGAITLFLTRPQPPSRLVATPGSADPLQTGEIKTILEPDAIYAVDHPTFTAASASGLPDATPVIGVAIDGHAHAFPIAFLSRVEIVNDRLGSGNIAITW